MYLFFLNRCNITYTRLMFQTKFVKIARLWHMLKFPVVWDFPGVARNEI